MKIGLYATGSATSSYQDLLDQIRFADESGFDSVWLRERHFHPDHQGRNYCTSPFVVAAYVASRTKRVRIGIGARILPLDHPVHIAEDAATVDVISGGRLDLGIARIGENDLYQGAFGVTNEETRGRFEEALDVICKAWSQDHFSYEGKHFKIPDVSVYPKPLQKPHPPIWIPGFGSKETVEWCADPSRRYAYLAVFMPDHLVKWFFDTYREAANGFGYEASPYQMGHLFPIYVAKTDRQAFEEAGDHALWLYHKGLRHKWEMLFPPGYTSVSSMRRITGFAHELNWETMDVKELNDKGYCLLGSVETVRERLVKYIRELNFGILLPLLHFGDMPHDRTIANMELFASDVMPFLKREFKAMEEKWWRAA